MTAEDQYRQAFERLKAGTPQRVPTGTPVTQNNVAREAGADPSALKKSRFPTLIAEIQRYVTTTPTPEVPSKRQAQAAQRKKNKGMKEKLAEVAAQRDKLASLLLEADATILELRQQLDSLQRKEPGNNVVKIGGKRS